ncbi:hypothetical protein DL766_009434 [Monosporascus sp. MC13-8B]|uniref:Zn(2)-C6 fungal-type domain-containing protein n=1 Tax=Monosporascus cannonballus TaxID=155416 RepID=A0ABY0HEE7_9PEZI|nr:hypothetical protein DL763_007431 [Monosporascus cannonballus]RYO91585.1 hypothetical protein DL762_002118 [Monosporascus cannonballus]RYP15331.1 hypothetical protein DL766_009434 [Monosporascus sp. MC13-8B]
MFRISMSSSDLENPLSFRVADPPFERSKIARESNFACDRCKNKKLKCTREKTGCQRCLASKILCRYTRAIKAVARNHKSAVAPSLSSPVNGTPPSSVAVQPGSAGADDRLTSTNAITSGTVEEGPRGDSRDGLQEEQAEQFQPPDVCGPITDDFLGPLDFENWWLDAFEQPGSSPPGAMIDGSVLLGGRAPAVEPPKHHHQACQSFEAGQARPGRLFPHSHDFNYLGKVPSCRCVDLLLRIQEQLTIRIDGHRSAAAAVSSNIKNSKAGPQIGCCGSGEGHKFRDPLQMYQILAFYKAAVKHCLSTLQCKSCQAQSAIVMLLIAVCDQMVDEFVLLPPALTGMLEVAPLRMGHGGFTGVQGISAPDLDANHGFARQRDMNGAWAGWCDLDVDDHQLVLGVLTTHRLRMLDHLVRGVTGLVQQHSWNHHLAKLEAISKRLASKDVM